MHDSDEIWSKVRRMFYREESAAKTVDRRPAPNTSHAQEPDGYISANDVDSHVDPEFERKLADLNANPLIHKFIVAGKISLLNIASIRSRLGERWPALEERVHFIVRETLRNRLGAKDLHTQFKSDSYVIVFGESDTTEAKLKSLMISREINAKLFGEADLDDDTTIEVQAVVARADGKIMRQSIDVTAVLSEILAQAENDEIAARMEGREEDALLAPEQTVHLLDGVEHDIASLERHHGESDDLLIVEDRAQRALRQLRELEEAIGAHDKTWTDMRRPLKPITPKTIEWNGMTVEPIKVVREFIARGESELARRKPQVMLIREAIETRTDEPAATFSFLPIWNVTQKKIALYLCHAAMNVEGIKFAHGALVNGNPNLSVLDTTDRLVLRHAKAALNDGLAHRLVSIVSVPVHFSTLNRLSAREQYLQICHAIPDDLRRMLLWEVVACPPNFWRTNLAPALEPLQHLSRTIFFRLDLTHSSLSECLPHLEFLSHVGIRAVGLDLGHIHGSEALANMNLTSLFKGAHAHSLACYAFGLNTPAAVQRALKIGFDYLAGSAIAEPVEAPQGVVHKVVQAL